MDTFIFPLNSSVAKQIENNPTENIFLRFSEYDKVQILFDGVPRRAYKYLGGIMNDPKDWKSLCLKKANPGNFIEEEIIFKFLSNLGGYTINLANDKLLVFNDKETIIDSELEKIEEDAFTISRIGILNIGVKFRLVNASSMATNILKSRGDKPMVTFGSLSPDGYAVTYELY
ncbi:MAG TPA: hypothetical protein VKZ57_12920 [Sphingobacterium sp.]|nr:hypothetical protein [Sphingobacterium sp.]